jgi:hypothetical protein
VFQRRNAAVISLSSAIDRLVPNLKEVRMDISIILGIVLAVVLLLFALVMAKLRSTTRALRRSRHGNDVYLAGSTFGGPGGSVILDSDCGSGDSSSCDGGGGDGGGGD